MDSFDMKIISLISLDSRIKWADLASQVGLSAPATAERVQRLIKKGVIKGFGTLVDGEKTGCECTAFVFVTLEHPKFREDFIQLVRNLKEVQECHHIAGEDDYLLKIKCRNTKDLDRVISYQIKSVDGVTRTRTTIVMNTEKETIQMPLYSDKFINDQGG